MISAEYKAINSAMHQADDNYGRMGARYAGHVRTAAHELGAASILDYGCGKHTLRDAMPEWGDFREYDPALPGYDVRPEPADFVACTDVLEHIEPGYVDAVLDDLRALGRMGVLFVIATKPAQKLLPDGTNPHKIVEDEGWWLTRLCPRWRIDYLERNPKRFMVVGRVR